MQCLGPAHTSRPPVTAAREHISYRWGSRLFSFLLRLPLSDVGTHALFHPVLLLDVWALWRSIERHLGPHGCPTCGPCPTATRMVCARLSACESGCISACPVFADDAELLFSHRCAWQRTSRRMSRPSFYAVPSHRHLLPLTSWSACGRCSNASRSQRDMAISTSRQNGEGGHFSAPQPPPLAPHIDFASEDSLLAILGNMHVLTDPPHSFGYADTHPQGARPGCASKLRCGEGACLREWMLTANSCAHSPLPTPFSASSASEQVCTTP